MSRFTCIIMITLSSNIQLNFNTDNSHKRKRNKANLRDLIPATSLIILLELDWNDQFFGPYDLEIWWMTLKNNWASFRSHWSIQTGVTVRKLSIRVKIVNFLFRVTLKFDGWPWKTIGHLFYATSSFVHFTTIGEFKLELQSRNAKFS